MKFKNQLKNKSSLRKDTENIKESLKRNFE
jgi:hypothetical protein